MEPDRTSSAIVPSGEHLVISHPDCPTCLAEVACDGTSYWCEGCGGTWDMNGTSLDRPDENGRSLPETEHWGVDP